MKRKRNSRHFGTRRIILAALVLLACIVTYRLGYGVRTGGALAAPVVVGTVINVTNTAQTSGALPPGLTLNGATGAISGTPNAPRTFNFSVKAQTSSGCSAAQTYSLTVACPAITLSDLLTPGLNSPFNQSVTASPSGGGYSFAVTTGALPMGLSLNGATGAISGTPTAAGTYSFTLTATGSNNCTGIRQYSLVIGGAALTSAVVR